MVRHMIAHKQDNFVFRKHPSKRFHFFVKLFIRQATEYLSAIIKGLFQQLYGLLSLCHREFGR